MPALPVVGAAAVVVAAPDVAGATIPALEAADGGA